MKKVRSKPLLLTNIVVFFVSFVRAAISWLLVISERLAIYCASGLIKNTSKGPCRSSKTKGINSAISNELLARQGLISLKDLWINIHYSS